MLVVPTGNNKLKKWIQTGHNDSNIVYFTKEDSWRDTERKWERGNVQQLENAARNAGNTHKGSTIVTLETDHTSG